MSEQNNDENIFKNETINTIYTYLLFYPEDITNRINDKYGNKLKMEEKTKFQQLLVDLGSSNAIFNRQQEKIYINFNNKDRLIKFSNREDVKKGYLKLDKFIFEIRPKYEYHSTIKLLGDKNIRSINNNEILNNIKNDIKYNYYISKNMGFNEYYIYFSNKRDMYNIINKYLDEKNINIKDPKTDNLIYNMTLNNDYLININNFKTSFNVNIKNIHNLYINNKSKDGNEEYLLVNNLINEIDNKIKQLELRIKHIDEFKNNILK